MHSYRCAITAQRDAVDSGLGLVRVVDPSDLPYAEAVDPQAAVVKNESTIAVLAQVDLPIELVAVGEVLCAIRPEVLVAIAPLRQELVGFFAAHNVGASGRPVGRLALLERSTAIRPGLLPTLALPTLALRHREGPHLCQPLLVGVVSIRGLILPVRSRHDPPKPLETPLGNTTAVSHLSCAKAPFLTDTPTVTWPTELIVLKGRTLRTPPGPPLEPARPCPVVIRHTVVARTIITTFSLRDREGWAPNLAVESS